MKYLIILAISCLFTIQNIFAYQANDSLYVWAVSGLNMRATPDVKGKKIMTIPYGEKVKVEHSYGKNLTLQVIEPQQLYERDYNGFKMTGQWNKVSFMDTVGYVFNGYLSKFPTIEVEEKRNYKTEKTELYPKESFNQWALRNFGLLKTTEKTDMYSKENMSIYGNGVVIVEIAGKSADEIITVPNMSHNEAFLLLNIVLFLDSEKEGRFFIRKQNSNEFYGEDLEMCSFRVDLHFSAAIISIGCSC